MTQIGRYQILEEVGRGGFATVFKARDSQLNRLVALKVLHAGWSADPDFVRRFQGEAETVANLRHPNIVVIYDVGEIERQLFISMEYLPGENLQAWLTRKGAPLTVAEALPILEPMAAALDYAHGQGIIHRDVKPSNMMLDEGGEKSRIVLTDFGLVKAMENSLALTSSGQTLGSPEYMAPEQADPNRREEIGPHSDRYALGIVAYQMLAGRVPFPGNSISTLNAHVNLPVPPPQEVNDSLSDGTAEILQKMLAKEPAERYPTASAFVEALRATARSESRIQQRQARVAPLYARLQQARASGAWVDVITLAGQIGMLWPGYRDVSELQTEAQRMLKQPQPERRTEPLKPESAPKSAPIGAPSQAVKGPVDAPKAEDGPSRTGLRKAPLYVWGIVGALLVGIVLVALSSLGPSASSDPEEVVSVATERDAITERTEPPAVAAPEMSLTIWADETQAPILAELAPGFQEDYGVALNVESFDFADISVRFRIAAPAGEGPDLFVGAHDRLGDYVASGLVAPVELGDKVGEFTGVSLEAFTMNGELYGLPYATENLALFRNTDLAPEAPTTWDELAEMSQAAINSGEATVGLAFPGTSYDIYPLDTSFGGYIFGLDDAGNWDPSDLGVNNEGMIAAGDWLIEQVDAGIVSPNTEDEEVHALFEDGGLVFIMDGPWSIERYRGAGVPYEISDIPSEGQPFGGVQGFMVNALGENVLLAQTFLTEFIATDPVMEQLYLAGNRPSAFVSVLEATDDPDLAAFDSAGSNAHLIPNIPEMGAVWGPWGDAFSLILAGEEAPAAALATAAQRINEVIGGAFAGMVNVPGSWQAAAGCEADWDPACEVTALTESDDGLFTGEFEIPAGDYETKVAHDGAWAVNYGVDGAPNGDNIPFSLTADGIVTFSYDPETHILAITIR